MTKPKVTVVMPVYNRQRELRRALASLVAQSMGDFECIVVDDASSLAIEPIVAEYDDRFIYVRNPVNGGPCTARFLGLERMNADLYVGLDSDNELFPWALERAVVYLDCHPEVGGVTGLYEFPEGLRVRVWGGSAVFTPTDYIAGNPAAPSPDSVAVYRRETVEEWLTTLRRDYYQMEFAFVLSHRLRHTQLWVDEPWGRYHIDAPERVSTKPDPRSWRDAVLFVEEFRPRLGTTPCVPVDRFLRARWFDLQKARRTQEAEFVRDWMAERGSGRLFALAEGLSARIRSRLPAKPSVAYLHPLGGDPPPMPGQGDGRPDPPPIRGVRDSRSERGPNDHMLS